MGQTLNIAIVGMAGVYPDAADTQRFWSNICNKHDAISDADPEWVGPYFEQDTTADDRVYTTKGGFLRELAAVDPLEVGIMPSVAEGSDPDHLTSLKMARAALKDAGYGPGEIKGDRAGVIIARGTYGNRGLASMLARGFFFDQMMDVIRQLRPDFSESDIRALQSDLKQQLPPYGGDVVGLLTPNVIASLIANRLDLMGPSYIVDAACASSLLAVDAAARELSSGRCDMMLVGGTHVQTPPQLFIQFCQISALSRDRLRPFQKGAEGTLLGEGCGMLVLKRLADAEAAGDRIYAVIKGVGVSSDGRAKGLLAPRMEGQVLAMQRAYQSSGLDPLTVDLIEAHGTGTTVGDKTEIESLSQVFGARGKDPQIAISAVKSMIGHCLPGTGAASMIKTALALHHKVLPPMLCDEPDPDLNLQDTPFYINNQTRPWIHGADTPRRAGINAFGFGGINAHVIVEEYNPPRRDTARRLHSPPAAAELFAIAADSKAELFAACERVSMHLRAEPTPSLAEVCKAASHTSKGQHRLAVVAASADELLGKLEKAIAKFKPEDARPGRIRGGATYSSGAPVGKLCVLFPGEGSQYPDMLAELCTHFPQVRQWFDFVEEASHARGGPSRATLLFPPPTGLSHEQRDARQNQLHDMDVGAETVFAASLGLQALLDELGLKPDAMLGHSTGENTALTASKVRRYQLQSEISDAVQAVNGIYQQLERNGRIVHGTLLTVGGLTTETRTRLMEQLESGGSTQLAMDNCPNQVVLFGAPEAVERLRKQLAREGAICQALPFGRAYHTPLFKPLADAFREYFKDLDFGPGQVPLYSARSCAPFPNTPDEIRELAAQQWENPVRFTQTLERLYADGYRIFLEVGPSANLSAFVTDSLRKREGVLALSCNTRRKPALSHFLNTLGQLFAAGVTLDLPVLYAQRQIEALDLSVAPKAGKLKAAKKALAMPAVQLPEKWRKPLPQAPTHPASQRPPSAAPETAPLANPQNPPANPGDPQAAALQAHFTLMQEFLDSQARVLGLATGQSAAAPEAEAASAPPSDDLRYPLLGAIIESKPGRLVMQRDYSLHTDAFLGDHCIGGTPSQNDPQLGALAVIPFTFSMEICAEAAARLIDRQDRVFVGMQNARGSRWLSFDHDQLQLRIIADHAQRQPDHDVIDCKLYLQGQGGPEGGLLVFEASVELAKDYPAAPPPTPWRAEQDHPQQFHPPGQLYEAGMFHGPRLQGCTRLPRWSDDGIEVQMRCLPTQDYFSFTPTPNFQFDAALLDAAGQAAGFWLQESGHEAVNCFPFRVRRLRVFAAPPAAGSSALCRGQIQMEDDTRLHARWDIIGPGDQLIMQAQGWEDRLFAVDRRLHHFRMDPPRRFLSQDWLSGQLPAGFSACRLPAFENNLLREGGGIWGRTLAYMVLNAQERAQFNALPTDTPRRDEWLMGRIAAKEAVRHWLQQRQQIQLASADIQIDNDAQGRPLARIIAAPHIAAPSISISHSRGQAAAIAADPGLLLGLDYQHLDRVQTSDLINGGFDQSERRWFKPHSPAAQKLVAVALWSAKEAAAKCAGTGLKGQPASWRVVECHLDPPSVAYGSARVEHDGASFDVVLQFESESAVSALCVAAPSGQAPPPPVHLNPSPSHELH